jgi:putative flippase GtrA
VRESSLVYLVAAVGCGLNILFLNIFTGIFHMDSMLAKVVTTAVVFLFNYLARKLGIYRERKPSTKTPS